ncbi:MAG TPA: ATP-binding protein [Polyangia bacterium]|nr:ATP-binding protein [Polyangia bacterium]
MSDDQPNVLLVDDVEANLVVLEALLGGLDCHLVRAATGNEALRQLLKREFAVILLDVQMPGMDGFEVARYARDNPSTSEIPIIFLTAMHSSDENLLRGYGTGAVDFLTKPINPEVLRAKVRVFLELYLGKRTLTDEIAAHKQTLADLELANQALRAFTNAASHDLREPLRAVDGFMQALDEDFGDTLAPQARDYLERSRRASQRMVSLLDSLLAYARLQKPIAWLKVDCNHAAEQVKGDLGERIAAAGATVTIAPLPSVRGDTARIYQLFLNLIGNAIKFRRPDVPPVVEVSADRSAEPVFTVADNGIGIPAEHQATVFEAFRRLHNRTQFDGSGLGLTICQQIVEQHGGRIWLESEPGKGTRVSFTLGKAV